MEFWIDRFTDVMDTIAFGSVGKVVTIILTVVRDRSRQSLGLPQERYLFNAGYTGIVDSYLNVLSHPLGTSRVASETLHGAFQPEFIRKHKQSEKIHPWVERADESGSPEMDPKQVVHFKTLSPGPCVMLRHSFTLSKCPCLGLEVTMMLFLLHLAHYGMQTLT